VLSELVKEHPLEQGLTELIAYLSLASEDTEALIDESRTQTIGWTDPEGFGRKATMPLVIFSR
jgi:hypothetical protein